MKAKKILSMIVSMFILATIVAVPAVAATGYAITPSGAAVAKYGSTYELTIKVTSPDNVYGAGCFVAYDTAIFTPVTENITGCAALNPNMVESVTVNGKTAIKINSSNDAATYNGETVWATIPFTVADGTDNVDTSFELIYSADDADMNGKITWLDKDFNEIAFTDITFGKLDIKAVKTHTAPTITGVTVTSPAVVGTELTAATEGFVDSWGLADASTFTWVIGDKTVSTSNKYTPAIADINKTIKVTATPTVAEEEGMDEGTNVGEAKFTEIKVVIPAEYAPTVSIEIGEEGAVLAALPVVPVATYEETYKEVTEYDVEYTYYVVPAELVAEAEGDKLEAAIAAVEAATEGIVTLEGDTYAPEYKDDYAVVKAEATYTIAGEAHATKPVDYAAALIKGEPPVLAEGADAVIEKLAAKKFFTSSTPDVTDVEFESKVVEGAVEENYDKIDYSYAWYLTSELKTADTFVADEATAITAEAALATPGKVKLSKVEATEGKYLVAVITATDALTISSSTTVFFTNPIKKATGGSGTQGGASLVTGTQGGTVVEPEKPGTDEPAVDEKNPQDPAGEANDKGATVFTDVDKEAYAWAYEGIDALTKAGVIKGMTETTFGPELTATNAQMIALAVRIAGLTAEGATTDKVDAEHWVAAELAVADAKGILGVYGDKIDVEGATSREIAFTLLYNALKAAGVELAETAEAIEFTDAASIDANCVEAINALVKAGIVNGMGDGTLAPKATLTRAQLAKILGMANALVTK